MEGREDKSGTWGSVQASQRSGSTRTGRYSLPLPPSLPSPSHSFPIFLSHYCFSWEWFVIKGPMLCVPNAPAPSLLLTPALPSCLLLPPGHYPGCHISSAPHWVSLLSVVDLCISCLGNVGGSMSGLLPHLGLKGQVGNVKCLTIIHDVG